TIASPQGEKGKRWGDGSVEITEVTILDRSDQQKFTFECGEPCVIEMHCQKHRSVASLVFGIAIYRIDDLWCYGTNTFIDRHPVDVEELGEEIVVRFNIDKLNLVEGEYYINVASTDGLGTQYDYIVRRISFTMYSNVKEAGVCRLDHSWEVSKNM
ncbi:MAG: Wzt carbohydrate-binding domain-containing protein, partial [Desulfitobacteriaceae bacterium]